MAEPTPAMTTYRTLVLIGPHGVGKSTLGTLVSARLGWAWNDELGRRFREEALAADPGRHAMQPDAAFDRTVFAAELARDATADHPRVVETWHPGNLAYARGRDPAVAAELEGLARRGVADVQRRHGRVLVQPLCMARDTGRARCTEPGPDDALLPFFHTVGETAHQIARAWELDLAEPIWTDRRSVDECVALICSRLGVRAAWPS
jgi:hypothetical protein